MALRGRTTAPDYVASRGAKPRVRASEPELDPEMLGIIDDLIEKGRATLHPKWAAAAGAGAGEPDRGDDYPF